MNGLQISILILVFSLSLFNFFFWSGIIGKITKNRRKVEERIESIEGKRLNIFDGISNKRQQKKKALETKAKTVQSAQKQKLMNVIFNELILADIMMRPEEFSMMWIILAFGPSSLSALFSANIISSITLAVVGMAAPIFWVKMKKKKRTKLFENQLSDALLIMCNCLRSGLSFQQSLENIANEMPSPISIEFSRVTNEIKYGATLEDSLNNMVERVRSADLMLAVSAVNIQRQTGGNLSFILDTISETIKERLRIKGEISSITAQGRMSGMIIGALPIVVSIFLFIVTPDYMTTFFTTLAGKLMIVVAVVLEIIGFFMIRKVVTVEY
ncbi:MAG: hypothetical protein GX107_00480 [Clostridiales bacterium]|nr:hypothetical protein [Clostridiales bacterium]